MSRLNSSGFTKKLLTATGVHGVDLSFVWAFVLFATVVWISHFLLVSDFGLYEDDYAFISPVMGWSVSDLLTRIADNLASWPQGRPIGWSLPLIFSFVGFGFGGLMGVYIIAFLILCANAFLVYALVKRISSSESLALTAGLAFSIFPADSTRSLLMHATGLQPSLTFVLLASLSYLNNKRTLSYILALGALLTYESPFMVFLGIPLIAAKWNRDLAKRFLSHCAIMSIMVIVVLFIRGVLGDDRLDMGVQYIYIPGRILAAIVIGPLVIAGMYLAPMLLVPKNLDIVICSAIIFGCGFTLLVFYRLGFISKSEGADIGFLNSLRLNEIMIRWKIHQEYWNLVRLTFVGLILLSLGYVFSFTHFPPTVHHGRLTSVHLAASIGGSILFACIAAFIIAFAKKYFFEWAGIGLMIAYTSIAIGFNVMVQEDFVLSWCNQKSFWRDAVRLTPDFADGTVIFFVSDGSAEPEYIHTHSWADAIVLAQIFEFPADWSTPLRLFTVASDWTNLVDAKGSQFNWMVPTSTTRMHTESLPESNVILLQTQNRNLVRVDEAIPIGDRKFQLKPISPMPGLPILATRPLFDLLMANGNGCNSIH